MRKVLLINPSEVGIEGNTPKFLEKARGCNPPLGLMYLASYLEKNSDLGVDIYDSSVDGNLFDFVQGKEYVAIGISVLTFTLRSAVNLMRYLKRCSPTLPIYCGGTHATIYPEEMLRLGFDLVVLGEGEEVFANTIKKGKAENINYGHLPDIDSLPFPKRVNVEKYYSVFSDNIATSIITSRGCPYQCAFCYRPVFGKKVRYRSVDNVMAELDECRSMGIDDFMFYDDTFTLDKNRAIEICKHIYKDQGCRPIRFDVRTRVDSLSDELVYWLKKAGAIQIRLGVESGSQRVLDLMRKGITLEQTRKAFELCKKYRLETCAYAMVGYPGETRTDIESTISFLNELKPDFVHLSKFIPFPCTKSYEVWKEKYGEDVWLKFAKDPFRYFEMPKWKVPGVEEKELDKLIMEYYSLFYINWKFISRNFLKNIFNPKKLLKYAKAGKGLYDQVSCTLR